MKQFYGISLAFTFLFSTCVVAVSKAQVSVGVQAGYSIADLSFNNQNRSDYSNVASFTKPVNGVHVDLLFNFPLAPNNLYLQSSLRFVTKGTTFTPMAQAQPDLTDTYITSGTRMRLSYLEVPVNLVYKQPIGIGRVLVGAGLYGAYGLNGRYEYKVSRNGATVTKDSRDVQFSRSANDNPSVIRILPWDAGFNGLLGLEFNNHFIVSANYAKGVIDVDRTKATNTKNYYVGLTLGYLFSREDY
ncbi:PorT family protein [Chitinophaga horti]|uniref:PorT family protein n=1 Tax=Chitinophaga horti TaxID=2920382 RepID=A0ABY6J2T1_9BACT|nr:porin family protein [Chitinophaga horti]UYQ92947.1 PorT family protein [Chitinophaga horti]